MREGAHNIETLQLHNFCYISSAPDRRAKVFKRFKDGEKRAAKEIYEYLQLTGSKIKTLAHIRRNYEVGDDNLPKIKKHKER